MTHEQAKRALEAGTPADLICQTCSWDRLCVQPPTMSAVEIRRHVDDAVREAEATNPKGSQSTTMLFATALYAGRDTAGQLCPVFASRLSSPDGRTIADKLRAQMRAWGTDTSAIRHAGQTAASATS